MHMHNVFCSAQLSNRMHGQSREPQVHRSDTGFCSRHWPNGTAASQIGAGHIMLHRRTDRLRQPLYQCRCFRGGRVALPGIHFNNRAAIKFGGMVFIMFMGEIGVNAMSVINRKQATVGNDSVTGFYLRKQTFDKRRQHITVGANI